MASAEAHPHRPAPDGTLTLHGGEWRVDPRIRNNPFPFCRALRKDDVTIQTIERPLTFTRRTAAD